MGFHEGNHNKARDEEEMLLNNIVILEDKVPKDRFHLAYLVYFAMGTGFLLPWNAFITAVDYFTYLYPGVSVDRIFAVVYMVTCLVVLLVIVRTVHKTNGYTRINVGLLVFLLSLLVVPIMDVTYLKGRRGLLNGYYVTVGAIALCGIADSLVQGGVFGAASELPERYMQAVVSGTAASGVLVSILRILTKSIYPQNPQGLRNSANLYFTVSIIFIVICMVCHNAAHKLPVIQYYKEQKELRQNVERGSENNLLDGKMWKTNLRHILGRVKWSLFGLVLIYIVTLSIFPGYITEDVHSELLKDWYPILLITFYNVCDLLGKSATALYLIKNTKITISGCIARLLFYPLFVGCLHGPKFLRTEVPVSVLTCLLGLSNGYLTSVLMINTPQLVESQYAETTGIVMVLFLVLGLAFGSIVAWFWVI